MHVVADGMHEIFMFILPYDFLIRISFKLINLARYFFYLFSFCHVPEGVEGGKRAFDLLSFSSTAYKGAIFSF